jgi:hypothetical protein
MMAEFHIATRAGEQRTLEGVDSLALTVAAD